MAVAIYLYFSRQIFFLSIYKKIRFQGKMKSWKM